MSRRADWFVAVLGTVANTAAGIKTSLFWPRCTSSTFCPVSITVAEAENLALACVDCNLHKGPNVAGYDPLTGALTELFHPRRQVWSEHFEWHGVVIVGKTAVGRTTVEILQLNSADRLELRIQNIVS